MREEFERIWNEADIVTNDWITDYTIDYNLKKVRLQSVSREVLNEIKIEHTLETDVIEIKEKKSDELEIVPNSMQKEAMTSLAELRSRNENRALLIAATGTGKTYASAFGIKYINKFLISIIYIQLITYILPILSIKFCY